MEVSNMRACRWRFGLGVLLVMAALSLTAAQQLHAQAPALATLSPASFGRHLMDRPYMKLLESPRLVLALSPYSEHSDNVAAFRVSGPWLLQVGRTMCHLAVSLRRADGELAAAKITDPTRLDWDDGFTEQGNVYRIRHGGRFSLSVDAVDADPENQCKYWYAVVTR
jgi:hypothetical protein